MKKSIFFTAALSLIALCPSCVKELADPDGGASVELTISSAATKTAIDRTGSFYWTSGDALKVFETAKNPGSFSSYDSAPGVTEDDGRTMSFNVSLGKRSASSFSYTAFYPKTSLYSDPSSASAVAVSIPYIQVPSIRTFDKTADVLIAKPVETASSQPDKLEMQFARPLAIGNVSFTGLPDGSEIKTVSFSAVKGGNPVHVAGATTFDLRTATPVSSYGDAKADDEIVINCKNIDYTLLAESMSYSVREYDWTSGSISDPVTVPDIKGCGIFFTCWPFSLEEGDSFRVVVRIGEYTYTKNITVPSGRTFSMPEGGLGTFSVDMSSVSPVYSPDDYLTKWDMGEDIEIGGRIYNKETYGAGTLIENGGSLPARTGVYFIDTDASVNLSGVWNNYSAGNLIIIGRTPGNRPTVTKNSAPCYYNGEGKSIALKNVTFVANSAPIFNLNAKLEALDIDDCRIDAGLFFSSVSDNTGFENICVKNSNIALCKENIQPGNRDNGITRGTKNNSMTKFEFCNNVVFPLNGTPSRLGFNQDIVSGVSNTVGEVVFKNNLFVDVAPYTAFANWTNDYKLTVTGNIIDFKGVRTDANSVSADKWELSGFARRSNGEALSNVTEGGNAVYYTIPSRYSTVAVIQPRTQNNRYPVAVQQETFLAGRDFDNGEFPLKSGALYAEAFTSDGSRFWGSVDCANHKIYINHVPRADMITEVKIWPEGCECSGLSGSWPSKTITVDNIQYDVVLPDYISGTPLSGYTLQWADEFTLDHVDRQAWRNTSSGGGADGYSCPDDNSLASVADGCLKLWYKTVSDHSIGYWPEGASLGYVAGGIDSRYHRDFSFTKDARLQVRVKWNEMKGLWQAAWLLADPDQAYGTSRKCVGGEIDMIEHLGTEVTMYQTLHTENTVTNDSAPANCGQVRSYKYPHNDCWFTFDVELVNAGTANADIKFYINGEVSTWYKDYKNYHPKSYWSSYETGSGYYWPYDLFEYCLILTAQVGGDWCGDPDGSTAIAAGTKAMTVDYVRYYTKN